MKKNGGFTLMELMIVIAIIMILAGAIVARIGTSGEKAKEAKARAELDEIAAGCRSFYADTGLWPANGAALMVLPTAVASYYGDTGVAPTAIPSAGSWKGPYLEVSGAVLPNDPWGTAYVVARIGGVGSYTLQARCGSAGHITTLVIVHRFGI